MAEKGDGEQGRKAVASAEDILKSLTMKDVPGLAKGGDASNQPHKFWETQPVPRYDESSKIEDGPIEPEDLSKVPVDPYPLIDGFEWVTMDLNDKQELDDVYQLLYYNYVEDDEAMFRFKYSASFLNWALKSPGWRADWHIGIRATSSRKLVAFISGVPITLRIRNRTVRCSEINFMCVHKKLRSKRLAPVLIREITRRCNRVGIWQAIYTGGRLLPTPVATCRYFHRSLDWKKLWECGFSPLPRGSTVPRQIAKYKLPESTQVKGLREMRKGDVKGVCELLKRYLERSRMAQVFDEGEIRHWLLDGAAKGTGSTERVVWTYVVEEEEPADPDPATAASGEDGSKEKEKNAQKTKPKKRITDFFSFYALESTVIGNDRHDTIRAAYLFYYATEAAFASQSEPSSESQPAAQTEAQQPNPNPSDAASPSKPTSTPTPTTTPATTTTPPTLQPRLNTLIHSALTLAKFAQFDVLNALSLLDNPLFLTEQRFGPGDGRLHYYLYNWRTGRLGGGVDGEMRLVTARSGDGVGSLEGGKEGDGEVGIGGEGGEGMGDVGVVML